MFFQAFQHETLELPKVLTDKLHFIPDLLTESKANNTVKKYYYGFLRWKRWALDNQIPEVDVLPAKALHVALYLACLVQSSNTVSTVVQAFYSINWAHSVICVDSPTKSYLVKNVLEGAKRRLAVPIKRKNPITPDLLEKMYNKFFCIENIYNQRTICACLLSYAGFLRISELLNLRRCDIQFFPTHISLFIEKSKTDVYRDGSRLVIAKTASRLCPVKNLELYLLWTGIKEDSDEYLFRNLVKVGETHIFRTTDNPMSYTRMRELFIDTFSPFVDDIRNYGLHSLRSGGATAAANLGVSDRIFKRHGRWRSDCAKDGYVRDDLTERLLVSQNLGL